ncbi:MAG: CheR family methyltransferase, partial [Gemmatimonadales bacterium]
EGEAEALEAIIRILQTATGVDFHHYKRPSLGRRIRHRVDHLGVRDFVAYLPRLQDDPGEVTALFATVLIQVTGFFREPATFGALQGTVIPQLLTGRSAGLPLRAWVVGCATGQEAYSLAISFLEVEAALGLEVLVRVFASDLSEAGLEIARTGRYSREDTAGLAPGRLERFFAPVDHGVQVIKRLREMCVFARHDITRDPPFAQLDLVFCSNLLIYLDEVLQRRVLQNIHYALKPGGYLILGPAETTTGVEGLFAPLDRKQKIYLRRHAPSRMHVGPGRSGDRSVVAKPVGPLATTPLQWSTAELQRAAERVFFAEYPAASVIVNQDLEVLHFQGRTAPYLEAPTGGPTASLLRLADPDLRLPLGRMLRRAKQHGSAVRRLGVRWNPDDRARAVDLGVFPVALDPAETQHFLVVFQQSAGRDQVRGGGSGGPDRASAREVLPAEADPTSRIAELEGELAENKEYLQAVIDRQDATQTELQAAYEASLSINEEYQSTNEELESSKEEMQSLNEELTTVNDQLNQRHLELQARADELNRLIEAIDMPMLLLSRGLHLRAFNSRAAGELRLVPGQVGRLLSEAHFPVPLSDLRVLTERAVQDDEVRELEVQDAHGRWEALRVWPVKPGPDGGTVAVALVDITKHKGDIAESVAARSYSEQLVETVMVPLVVLDDDLRTVHANTAFHRTFQTSGEAIQGVRINEFEDGAWAVDGLAEFLQSARLSSSPIPGLEITVESPRLGGRTLQLNAGQVDPPAFGPGRLLVAMEDITERRLAEASTMQASRMQAVGELAGGVAHEINNQMTAVMGFTRFLLDDTGEADPKREDLERVLRAARRTAEVTGQLLAFSRRQLLQMVVLDLNTLVAANETLLRRALGAEIELDISLGENVGQVRADQAQLEQVLVNLALNGRDAMGGIGRLTIATSSVLVSEAHPAAPGTATVPRGTYARLVVRDTGSGMDPATKARIFEPFFTTKPVGQGTGLGLASVYGTVKQSGGLIWVDSEKGRGTAFTIDLPRVYAE